ncbi:hypothetical protein T484DRAFT_1764049 [Baffinella frigidus]|nr:hypothetical protein T484DRAFT_1764049 [Cryptophyta sp. CCMP2293]
MALTAVFAEGRWVMVLVEADYNGIPLEEQLKIDVQTDVMVGPHGAGLTHSLQIDVQTDVMVGPHGAGLTHSVLGAYL